MGEAALREALQHKFAGGLASFPVTTAFSTGLSTAADLDRVAEEVQRRLGPRAFLGCSVQGAIGGRMEIEGGPSLAL